MAESQAQWQQALKCWGTKNEMISSYQPLQHSVNESFSPPLRSAPLLSSPLLRGKINSGTLLMSAAADGIIRRQQGCAKGKQIPLGPSLTRPPRTDGTQRLVVTSSGSRRREPPGRMRLFSLNPWAVFLLFFFLVFLRLQEEKQNRLLFACEWRGGGSTTHLQRVVSHGRCISAENGWWNPQGFVCLWNNSSSADSFVATSKRHNFWCFARIQLPRWLKFNQSDD